MMAKRLLGMMLATVLSIFVTKAQDLVYDGITPAPGSEISSFDFVLKFDLSKIIDNNGQADYGVGWVGFHNDKMPTQEKSVTLYEGTQEDGTVIGRLCDSNYNGKTAGFEASNIIELNFEGAVPKPGVKYTMVITNQFKVYTVAKGSSAISNSTFDCFKTPVIYEFIGGQASSESVSLTECSLATGQSLESVDNIKFYFNIPVIANNSNPVVIKEGDNIVATSLYSLVSEDGLCVNYIFDDVLLYKNRTYSVVLPANAVYSATDKDKGNIQFSVNVSGSSVEYFPFVSCTPEQNSTSIFSSIKAAFEVSEGSMIFKKVGVKCDLSANLYKNSISDENLIGKLEGIGNGNTITWTNTYALEPSSTYVVYVPKGQFPLYITSEDKYNYETGNGEVKIVLTTPSVAESGVPKVEFQAPVLGKYNANGNNVTLNNGDKISEISTIDFLYKDLRYSYNGEYVGATLTDTGSSSIEIYDITNGEPILIKSATLSKQQYETTTYYYSVYRAIVNLSFFEGHTYKVVLPAGTFGAVPCSIRNFSLNDELSVEFEGSAPSSVDLISCSLADNAELSELYGIVWKFKGEFVKNPDKNVRIFYGNVVSSYIPTFVSVFNGETTIKAFASNSDGTPETLKDGTQYRAILPEGIIYYASDESIKNAEYTVPFTGVGKTPEAVEYVNVSITTNDFLTTTQKSVKGKQFTYTVEFDDNSNWEVSSVKQGSKTLLNSNGVYTTSALNEDTAIAITMDYKGPWAEEVSTDVFEIPSNKVQIFKEDNHIVITGVTPENTISVYNVAGMLVNATHTTEGNDIVRLTVAPGQVYIVIVDGTAAKIQM